MGIIRIEIFPILIRIASIIQDAKSLYRRAVKIINYFVCSTVFVIDHKLKLL